jgi:hypothetical protein
MEIEKSYYNKVTSFIENANKNKNLEFEVRFWDENYEKIEINLGDVCICISNNSSKCWLARLKPVQRVLELR